MNIIQLEGIYSFLDNIKLSKIGDPVKLILNPYNKISSDAIGVYTIDNRKLGYLPHKVDITDKYNIHKINLNINQPFIHIICKHKISNIIEIINNPIIKYDCIDKNILLEVNKIKKYLTKEGGNILDIIITYIDDNFIDIIIKQLDNGKINDIVFNTVTRKYYNDNIYKYNEFFTYKLIKNSIFESFKIHRLEKYILLHYKSSDKMVNKFKNYYYDITKININSFDTSELFINSKKNGLAYNHEFRAYCYLDFYNINTEYNEYNLTNYIIEFINENLKKQIPLIIAKLVIANINSCIIVEKDIYILKLKTIE